MGKLVSYFQLIQENLGQILKQILNTNKALVIPHEVYDERNQLQDIELNF